MDAIDPAARHWLDAAVSGFDELAVSMLEANGVEKGEDTEALSNDQCGAVIALVSPEKRYQMMQELATQFPLVLPFELGSGS